MILLIYYHNYRRDCKGNGNWASGWGTCWLVVAHLSISLALMTGSGCDRALVWAFLKYHPMMLLVASS